MVGDLATETVGGILTAGQLVMRHSELTDNKANVAIGGLGVDVSAIAKLFDTRVTRNSAADQPGGIDVDATGTITLDPATVVINNRPTNCVGSQAPVPGCFG